MAFLDTLFYAMDVSGELDMAAVREEMEVFMFAGHDTTTATLAFALNFITENKNIFKKCRTELNAVFGASDRSPDFNDLKELRNGISLIYGINISAVFCLKNPIL